MLHDLLGESEFVAVCCPWTKETTHLIGRAAFAAMRSGTVLVNIARGEIIDEAALLQALAEGGFAVSPWTSTTGSSSARLMRVCGTTSALSLRPMYRR